MTTRENTTVFYRRLDGFPATAAKQVEVATTLPEGERVAPGDSDWHCAGPVGTDGEELCDIADRLGLSDGLTEISLIEDALWIFCAIRDHLGLADDGREWTMWRRDECDACSDAHWSDFVAAVGRALPRMERTTTAIDRLRSEVEAAQEVEQAYGDCPAWGRVHTD